MATDTSGREAIDLSVVIVNWNTCDELGECLRSVYKVGGPSMEFIVIDNASADGSADMVRQEFPQTTLIVNDDNLGFAKASNQGILASSGRYVMLLNPDSVVLDGMFDALVRFGDKNQDTGIFGPKILNPDGSLQYSCRRFPTLAAGVFRNTFVGRLFPNNTYTRDYLMTEWDHSVPRDVDWVSGAAMVIRRKLIEEIGLLDEQFFMYCEDVDMGYRAVQKGWRVSYCPMASVIHVRAKGSDQDPNRMILEFHRSMYKFFLKNYAGKSSIIMRAVVPMGLFARGFGFVAKNNIIYGYQLMFTAVRGTVKKR